MAKTIDIDKLQDLKNKYEAEKQRITSATFSTGDIDSMINASLELAKIKGKIELVKDLMIEVLS